MTELRNQLKTVRKNIELEGMEDAMTLHEYKEVESKTFHRLRLAYLKSLERLDKYVYKHTKGK